MAALNVFKTTTATVTTTNSTVYTAPSSYTGIILMAQITNITGTAATITMTHVDGATETELLKNFSIPGNDSASALTGKLVLQTGHSLKIVASANTTFKLVLSVLESANE